VVAQLDRARTEGHRARDEHPESVELGAPCLQQSACPAGDDRENDSFEADAEAAPDALQVGVGQCGGGVPSAGRRYERASVARAKLDKRAAQCGGANAELCEVCARRRPDLDDAELKLRPVLGQAKRDQRDQERAAKLERLHGQLVEQVAALTSGEAWRADAANGGADARQYNVNNVLLIRYTARTRPRVAGYPDLAGAGLPAASRRDRISIVAPMTYRAREDDEDEPGVRRLAETS
jgi:hypothetical protein